MNDLCGAIVDPAETAATQEYLAAQGVALARPDLVGFRDGETVVAWEAEEKLFGKRIRKPNQRTGTCVGVNSGQAVCDTILNAIAFGDLLGKPITEIAWEVAWANARTASDIGRGSLKGDGCVGSWIARSFHDYGISFREKIGDIDLTTQQELDVGQYYGKSGRHVPKQLLDAAAPWKITAAYWPSSMAEVIGCLRARYYLIRCGNWKTGARRNAFGYTGLAPCGGHCQSWRGVVEMADGPYLAEQQLWPGDCPQGEMEIRDRWGRIITLPDGVGLLHPDRDCKRFLDDEVIAFAPPFNLPRESA